MKLRNLLVFVVVAAVLVIATEAKAETGFGGGCSLFKTETECLEAKGETKEAFTVINSTSVTSTTVTFRWQVYYVPDRAVNGFWVWTNGYKDIEGKAWNVYETTFHNLTPNTDYTLYVHPSMDGGYSSNTATAGVRTNP